MAGKIEKGGQLQTASQTRGSSIKPCNENFLEKEELGNGIEDILDLRDWNGLVSMAVIHRCQFCSSLELWRRRSFQHSPAYLYPLGAFLLLTAFATSTLSWVTAHYPMARAIPMSEKSAGATQPTRAGL
jgi:hypothetical protein